MIKIIRGALTASGDVTAILSADRIVRAFSPEERQATGNRLVIQFLAETGVALTGGRGPRWLLFYIVPTCDKDLVAMVLGNAAMAALDGVTLPPQGQAKPFACEFDQYRPGVEFDDSLKLYTDPIRFRLGVHLT